MTNRTLCWLAIAASATACLEATSASGPSVPRLERAGVPLTPDTITVAAAPNVFAAASAQVPADGLLDEFRGAAASRTSWWTSDARVATVNQHGVIAGRQPGTATVHASRNGRSAFAPVKVVPGTDTGIRIIAHRTFMRRFPENTLVGVRGSFDKGADAVEVDVRLSADRVPVVMHDATVNRTTDGQGEVSALTVAELRGLNACARAAGSWPRCGVPLVTEVLAAARGRGGVLLHLYGSYSPDDLRRMLLAVREAGMDHQTVYISFDYPTLRLLRQLDPVVPLGYITTNPPPFAQIEALGRAVALVELQASVTNAARTRGYLEDAGRRRVDAGVWVAWDQAQARKAAALGFRHVVADVPIDRSTLTP